MLKIKDSVDLKELEKFGFEYHKKSNEYGIIFNDSYEIISVNEYRTIYLEILGDHFIGNIIEDHISILYDLIQAGLVEKVEDKQ